MKHRFKASYERKRVKQESLAVTAEADTNVMADRGFPCLYDVHAFLVNTTLYDVQRNDALIQSFLRYERQRRAGR